MHDAALYKRAAGKPAGNLFRERVLAVLLPHEHAVLEVYRDGRIFDIAFTLHALDYFFAGHGAFTFQNTRDNIAHDTGLITKPMPVPRIAMPVASSG